MSDAFLPTGTVTFLFSDIEGSTRLWESYPEAMKTALDRHDHLVRRAVEDHLGRVIKTTGDGCHAVFDTANDAACAALAIQLALLNDGWPELKPQQIRARLGLHTGEAGARANDYYGTAVNRAARLMSIGHGGQILVSGATADLLRDQLPTGSDLVDLGEHRLKDLVRPERVFQFNHADLPRDFPPLNSLDAFPNNLPIQLTSYVGREREMDEVRRLLDHARLLTLIGPGGIGKTRLALQVAANLLSARANGVLALPDGVWLVELASLTQPAQVLEQVAAIFQLRETRDTPLLEIVISFLRAKRLLLVIDNCEHLIEECARLSDTLLRASPGLKIMISSREALGIAGEVIFRVPSLSLPDPNEVNPATLMRYESAQLFLERSIAANPRFQLTERNAPAVARICQRLDGIPLALELAAARAPVFTPEQIAARLDDRFRLLTGGSRTSLPRQQTLRALIDWSYELLTPPEQALFRRLSVFTGGWTLEAAEAVCSGDPIQPVDVLDLLSNLVNKSLVNVSDQGDQARYNLLETIRQYAAEQLHALDRLSGAGETAHLRDRHLAYFLELNQQARQPFILLGFAWIEVLDSEVENIRSAFEWGLEMHPEDALRLIGDLFIYFNLRFNPLEAQRMVREAITRVEALPPVDGAAAQDRLRALSKGYLALVQFLMTQGEMRLSSQTLLRGVELARRLDDPEHLIWAYGFSSITAFYLDEIDLAASMGTELVSIARSYGITWALALGLSMLSWAEGERGNLELRHSLALEARSIATDPENPMAYNTMLMMGLESRIHGDLNTARDYLERCLTYTRVVRSRPYEAMVRSELAHIDRQMGNLAKAGEGYRATILLWKDLGHHAAIAHQLECFAFLATINGYAQRAVTLLGAADALREASSSHMTAYEQPEYRQEIERLRARLDDDEFNRHWAQGKRLNLEQAIEFALTDPALQ